MILEEELEEFGQNGDEGGDSEEHEERGSSIQRNRERGDEEEEEEGKVRNTSRSFVVLVKGSSQIK